MAEHNIKIIANGNNNMSFEVKGDLSIQQVIFGLELLKRDLMDMACDSRNAVSKDLSGNNTMDSMYK